jgi:integrase
VSELEAANARLKSAKARCSIQLRGNTFTLVATLPLRGTSGRKQQRISLGAIQLYEAERRAIELAHQLRTDSFSWDSWDAPEAPPVLTVQEFITAAEKLHASKYRGSPERGKDAWGKKWAPALRKLPPSGGITEATLVRVLNLMPEGSAGRRDQGNLLCSIGESLGLELPKARAACRGYGSAQLTPRDIPSDPEIEAAWSRIKLPHWRWMWGVCAAYGLRPHEAANLEIRPDGKIKIDDSTKTGSRICSACPSHWINDFQLLDLPRPTQSTRDLAKVFGDALERDGITLRPYVLRHAYAIRLISRKIPITISALMMGHSVDVHSRTYHRWITEEQVLAALNGFDL